MNSEYVRREFMHMADLLDKKNKGYGDAYSSSCEMFNDYEVSKIYEEYKRIEHITCVLGHRKGEVLKDALRDEIGYCMLMLERIHAEEVKDEELRKSKRNLLKRGVKQVVDFYNEHLRGDNEEKEHEDPDDENDIND